jgi:arginine N-succinyltransferase
MFLLREAQTSDENSILALAEHLNTLNLSPDRRVIQEEVAGSVRSFSGAPDPSVFDPERRFMFVLEDEHGKVVGTSALHAQHGTLDEPHTFFRVQSDERFSWLSLQGQNPKPMHKRHVVLAMGETFEGPTEVGGLVLHPSLRGHPDKLGTLLSLGRFMFIAGKRQWFRDRLLAELLPPLAHDAAGQPCSPLWDALGSKLTGLDYDSADKLSRDNKEFIHQLFPRMPIYACLLSQEAQAVIGKVGPQSEGARRLLEKIGFFDSDKIDPFDGGPHWEAVTDAITPIRANVRVNLVAGEPGEGALRWLIACFGGEQNHYRAVLVRARYIAQSVDRREGELIVDPEVIARLGAQGAPPPSKILAFAP